MLINCWKFWSSAVMTRAFALIGALCRHHVDEFHRYIRIGDLQGIGPDVAHPPEPA